ncbi:MAG: hypothetical protein J7K68_05840 [Candidatus Diapherotrites archaeon]|nr:hypothetical protein [Candidatus Diapherotrites archaeon]
MQYGTLKCFGKLRWALMHRPGEELKLVQEPSEWGFFSKPNIEKAVEEFDTLFHKLRSERVKIELIEPEEAPPPNLYYTRDLGLCTKDGIILANFREEYREGEELYLRIKAWELGIPIFAVIHNNYFEGGDFVQIADDIAALGVMRSSYGGFEEIDEYLDVTLLPVPHDRKFAHLDILFNMIREDLAILCTEVLPKEFIDFLIKNDVELVDATLQELRVLSSDVLMIKSNKVIINEEAEHTIKELEKRGVDVITTPLQELRKGGGGPGCLVFTLLRK